MATGWSRERSASQTPVSKSVFDPAAKSIEALRMSRELPDWKFRCVSGQRNSSHQASHARLLKRETKISQKISKTMSNISFEKWKPRRQMSQWINGNRWQENLSWIMWYLTATIDIVAAGHPRLQQYHCQSGWDFETEQLTSMYWGLALDTNKSKGCPYLWMLGI